MNAVELRDITFKRKGRAILDHVSWTIRQGEHWALIGANGSGKTTLLKIITGYEWASEGTVKVLGRVFGECDIRELRKTIGWVSSSLESRLPHDDTALDIVESGLEATLGLYRQYSDEERERARRALRLLDSESLAEQPFGVMSQGEQQRVLIARALVCNPALLVLDEPCAGLDPHARRVFLDDIGLLAAQPGAPTLLLVTHHIEEIGSWISRVCALKQGRVAAQGATQEILTGETLSMAFGMDCRVEFDGVTYWLRPSLAHSGSQGESPAIG